MAYPRKADIKRQIAAAREAGLEIGGVRIDPSGAILVLDAAATRRHDAAGSAADRFFEAYERDPDQAPAYRRRAAR